MNATYLEVVLLMFAMTFIRYVVFSGFAYQLVWKKLKDKLAHRKILFTKLKMHQIKGEIINSFITTVTYGIVLGIFLNKHVYPTTKIYFEIKDYGLPYFLFSMVFVFILHDLYFYITHRLLHTPFLFKHVHSRHHYSTSTTPWTSYSFHFGEALALVLFMPIIAYSFPVHVAVLGIFGIGSMVFNVLGHLGYEVMPRGFSKSAWFYILNTATHHSLHHTHPQTNFSLYFNYLDRVFSTNHSRYRSELEKHLFNTPSHRYSSTEAPPLGRTIS